MEPGGRAAQRARWAGILACVAILVILATALIALSTRPSSGSPRARPDQAINGPALVNLQMLKPDGTKSSVRSLVDRRPVLVNIWQADCPPCTSEMPLLEKVSTRTKRFAVVGVDSQDTLAKGRARVAAAKITYPWLRDPTGIFLYRARAAGLPRSLLIDPSGAVLATKTGRFTSIGQVTEWVDDHLRTTD